MKKIYHILCFILFPIACFSQAGTWTVKTFVPHFRNINAVQILPSGRIMAAGGNLSNDAITAMYYSDDSASTWYVAIGSLSAMLNGMHFPTATTGYTVGNSGLFFKSIDAGQTWLPLTLTGNMANRNYNGVYFTDANTGIAVGGNRTNDSIQTIIKTTDGGATWSSITDNLGSWLFNVRFIDANNGYAVGALGKILKTTDGGTSWTTVSVPVNLATRQFHDVYFFNTSTGIVVGGNPSHDSIQTIIKTTDGGATWNIISDNLSPMLKAVSFYNNNEGYATGDRGVIKYTNDQGATWTADTAAGHLPYGLNDIFFLNSNFGVAGGEAGNILVYKTSLLNSIENLSANVAMNLFPNPVENNLSILLKNFQLLPGKIAEIQIMDLTGRIIKTEMLHAKELLKIDVSSLSPQLYFLKLSIEGNSFNTKFIKN